MALQLVKDSSGQHGSLLRGTTLRRVSIPLRRVGRYQDAIALTREAYDEARRLKHASSSGASADILATIYLDLNDLDRARDWYMRALEALASQQNVSLKRSLDCVGARIAILEGNLAEAEQLISPYVGTPPVILPRQRIEELAIMADLCVAQARLADLQLYLTELRQLFDIAARHGGQDHPAHALFLAYRALGEHEEARTLLSKYVLEWRRETGPVPESLRAALA